MHHQLYRRETKMDAFSNSPERAKQELLKEMKAGKPRPEALPESISLEYLKEMPELFQHRRPPEHASQAHVRELMKAPKQGVPLRPIRVFWSGKKWVCIDGHHRLRAYRRAGWNRPVPVQAFMGTLDEAIGLAASENSKDSLAMVSSEKTNAAWRLVCTTELSNLRIVGATGTSERTITTMRGILKRLREMFPGEEPSGWSWMQARAKASGEEGDRAEFDLNEEAQQLANRLLKTFDKRLGDNLELLAEALEIYDKRLPGALGRYWRQAATEYDEAGEPLEDTEF